MKKIVLITLVSVLMFSCNQPSSENIMKNYYTDYYKYNLKKNNVSGLMESLNHLFFMDTTDLGKRDTLATLYLNTNNPKLALDIISVGNQDSETVYLTKGIANKSLGKGKEAADAFEKYFNLKKDAPSAYQLAELQYQMQRFAEAKQTCMSGIQLEKSDEKTRIFINKQNYIETTYKAAFLNIIGMIEIALNPDDKETAIKFFDEALKIDPKFALAEENKKAILNKK